MMLFVSLAKGHWVTLALDRIKWKSYWRQLDHFGDQRKLRTLASDGTHSSTTSSSASASAKRLDRRRSSKQHKESREEKRKGPNDLFKGTPKSSTRQHGFSPTPGFGFKPVTQEREKKADIMNEQPQPEQIPSLIPLTTKTLRPESTKLKSVKTKPISNITLKETETDIQEGDGNYEDVNLIDAPPPADEGQYENVTPTDVAPPGFPEEVLHTVKPEALRQVPPTGDSQKTTLTVDPPASIFPTTGGQLKHTLKNPRQTRMVYKIKCSNNNDYGISPVYSFVEAGGTATITVTRLPGAPKEDKMVIQFVEAPAGGKTPEEAFALASPWSYVSTTVPLRTAAGLPPLAAPKPAAAPARPPIPPPKAPIPPPVPPPKAPVPPPAPPPKAPVPPPVLPPKPPIPAYVKPPVIPAFASGAPKPPGLVPPVSQPAVAAKPPVQAVPSPVKIPASVVPKHLAPAAPTPVVAPKPSLPGIPILKPPPPPIAPKAPIPSARPPPPPPASVPKPIAPTVPPTVKPPAPPPPVISNIQKPGPVSGVPLPGQPYPGPSVRGTAKPMPFTGGGVSRPPLVSVYVGAKPDRKKQ
ncbi:hypothetical protein RB195_020460 [Necator americanus]|uniref:MSP domain-containing protein n=1 Tax=Necator americanus TaxID=51031 RepID=A0ABR1CKQ5_NECAM